MIFRTGFCFPCAARGIVRCSLQNREVAAFGPLHVELARSQPVPPAKFGQLESRRLGGTFQPQNGRLLHNNETLRLQVMEGPCRRVNGNAQGFRSLPD